jgi:uncharacterized protein (DUF58 family)
MSGSLLANDFLARLDRLDLLSRRILAGRIRGDSPRRRAYRSHGASLELADWRDYAPGDDPRFIDWNLCARLDKLLIKLFVVEQELSLHLLVDTSNSVDFGSPGKLLYLQQLAAAIGFVALANRHPVRIWTIAGPPAPAGLLRGRADLPRMLRLLDDLSPSGVARLEPACRRLAQGRRGGLCVILSDFLFSQDMDRSLALLAAGGHELFCIQTLSPQELSPHLPPGDARLIDSEDGRELHLPMTTAVLAQYRANLDLRRESVRQSVIRHGGTYVFACTDEPFDTRVLDSLRRGGLLG